MHNPTTIDRRDVAPITYPIFGRVHVEQMIRPDAPAALREGEGTTYAVARKPYSAH
jgi:hypothetical protein